jgi:hypothetical protein
MCILLGILSRSVASELDGSGTQILLDYFET